MPLMKCADGVYRSPIAALEALDVHFVQYETETPDSREEPPASVEVDHAER